MSTTRPPANRDLILSCTLSSFIGVLSADIIIWDPLSIRLLKVWKNSSCKLSFPLINWISSIIKTEDFLKKSLKFTISFFFIDFIKWYINLSADMNITLFSDWSSSPIALRRCVFPKPTPPQIYKGLYRDICSHTFFE